MFKTRLLATLLGVSLIAGTGVGCDTSTDGVERWTTTHNTNVAIDWDKINDAYRTAEGPEDFEKKVNEIYEGDEIISVAVADVDDKTQEVIGFFDKNTDGKVDEPEKIFSIKRSITGEGQAQYQTNGYGYYGYYHSPFISIASGMMMGAMLSSMFSPSYVPVRYVTSSSRVAAISSHRSGYRAANPAKFSKPSRSGRSYGGGSRPSSRMRGGSRFGVTVKSPIVYA